MYKAEETIDGIIVHGIKDFYLSMYLSAVSALGGITSRRILPGSCRWKICRGYGK